MGFQARTFDYHGVEQTLRGEIIQIGAVKVNESMEVLDTFSMNLKPRIFRKLHYHVARVTGLTQADLDHGVPIKEGLRRFKDWAGEDACFAEWGMDDVPVLKQNLFLVGLDENWPKIWYDTQWLFLREHPRQEGEEMKLESVINRLGLPMDRPFHDALADALYTADVCRQLDMETGLELYPDEAAMLREGLCPDADATYLDFTCFSGFLEKEAFRENETVQGVTCPTCGGALSPAELWLKRGNTGYYTLRGCPAHHDWLMRIKLMRRDGLHWSVARCLEVPTEASMARWNDQKRKYLARMKKAAEKKEQA